MAPTGPGLIVRSYLYKRADMDPFSEIRPYHDGEIRPVLDRLLETPEFLRSVAAFRMRGLYRFSPALATWVTRHGLRRQLRDVNDVRSMQNVIAGYMDRMIERTTTGLTHSGLDQLSPDRAYLFLSNHRDIAMDPAFVNYMLYHGGFDTVYIAIGDNLLKRPFVTDLMRLNKSFIVKRNLRGRELLQSSLSLSEYIHHLITHHCNIWIAQREGRAKNGIDRTEPALLKMLGMAKRKAGLASALRELHLVPVSISYEYDPCDLMKAKELEEMARTGRYEKDENSDINSIVTGMIGYKGHVHVHFGAELDPASDAADEMASQIDRQIIHGYRLQGSNYLALEKLRDLAPELVPAMDESQLEVEISEECRQRFEKRLESVPEQVRPWYLQMYANPVISRHARGKEDPFAPLAESEADTDGDGSAV